MGGVAVVIVAGDGSMPKSCARASELVSFCSNGADGVGELPAGGQPPLRARMPGSGRVVNAFATFSSMAAVRRVLIRKAGPA